MTNFNSNLTNLFNYFKNDKNKTLNKLSEEDKQKLDVNKDGKVNNSDLTQILKSENLFDFNNDGIVDIKDIVSISSQGVDMDGVDGIDEIEKAFLQKFKTNITNEIFNNIKNNKSMTIKTLLDFEEEIAKMTNDDDKKFWKTEIKKFENQIITNLQSKKDVTPDEIYALFDAVKGKDMDSTLLGNNTTTWQKTLTTVLTKMTTTNLSKNMTVNDLLEFEEKIETIKTEIENMNFSNAKTSVANKKEWTKVFTDFEKQITKNLQTNTDINEDGLATMDDLQKLWKDTENVEEKVLFNG